MTTRLERRTAMLANGYDELIPLIGKRPCYSDWSNQPGTTVEEVSSWETKFPRATNTGLLAAKSPGFDIDITDPTPAQAMVDTVTDWVDGSDSIIMVRYGNAPKCLIPFHTDTPFGKMRRVLRDPSGKEQKLEFLGAGQQYVVDGAHPDINKPYAWAADRSPINTPRSALPAITAEDARKLFDHCCDRLIQEFGYTEVTGLGNDPAGDGEKYDPIKALRTMHPSSAGAAETQCSAIMSLLNRQHHPDEVQEVVVTETMKVADAARLGWTRDVEERAVAPRLLWAVKTLCSRHDPEEHGDIPAWLNADFHEAWLRVHERGARPQLTRNPSGWYVRAVPHQYTKDGADAADGATAEQAKSSTDAPSSNPRPKGKLVLKLQPFRSFDVAALPPRAWLYGKHYQRRTVSLTAGPGGMGKSSLDMVEAIAMATCRNLLGEQPEERLRVWYHNGEDPLDEIKRRIAAICQHYKTPQSELEGWLFVTSGNEFPLRVAKGYSDLKIDHELVQQISAAVAENKIDLAIFDPLVTLHNVSELDTGKMDSVVRLFAAIGDENDASIELAHHVRKPAAGSNGDYDVHDIRGVGAITDATRAARVLNRMSEKDAETAGCNEIERLCRFRVDRAKANYSPPQVATWRQFINIELANGDEVGVVAPWSFPGQDGPPSEAKTQADRRAEELYLTLLGRLTLSGVRVTLGPSANGAPIVFARQPEAKAAKVGKGAFAGAQDRLLAAGRICAETDPTTYGRTKYVRAV
jgi:hypothetical protein